jgi:hypothetical protein
MDGWVDGSKSRFKDCLQHSKRRRSLGSHVQSNLEFREVPTKPLSENEKKLSQDDILWYNKTFKENEKGRRKVRIFCLFTIR